MLIDFDSHQKDKVKPDTFLNKIRKQKTKTCK